jgi:hypothetical protein
MERPLSPFMFPTWYRLPGAGTAKCRTRPSRPSTAGIRPTAEGKGEQPRRDSGLGPEKPAASGPAAFRSRPTWIRAHAT